MKSLAFASLFALLLAACGGQDIDPGITATTSSGTGGATASGTGGGGAGGSGGSTGPGGAPQALANVLLVHGADTVTVDVASLPTTDYKGAALVPLTALWEAGALQSDTSTLEFDFEGDDGFHPSQKGGACLVAPTGADLAKGYMLPETRSLVWDDSLGWPGCFSVKAVAKMIGLDAP